MQGQQSASPTPSSRHPRPLQQSLPKLIRRVEFPAHRFAGLANRSAHPFRPAAGNARDFIHGKAFEHVENKRFAVHKLYTSEDTVQTGHSLVVGESRLRGLGAGVGNYALSRRGVFALVKLQMVLVAAGDFGDSRRSVERYGGGVGGGGHQSADGLQGHLIETAFEGARADFGCAIVFIPVRGTVPGESADYHFIHDLFTADLIFAHLTDGYAIVQLAVDKLLDEGNVSLDSD